MTLATPKGPQRRERIAGGLSLIRFTVWSSVVHGAIMAVQAVTDHEQLAHLWGDVPALFLIAAVLAALTPRGEERSSTRQAVA